MSHLILNELVVKNLTKKQKRELIQILESDGVFDDPFDTILPVPEDVKVTGEEKWCRVNWGTEGLFGDFGCISFEKDTWFGDHEDDHTLIVTFLTVWTPPSGIVIELSRRYPEALFDLRTIDYDDTDAEVQWFRVFEGVAKLHNFDSKEHFDVLPRQAHGNLAMVTTAAPRRASYAVSGPRDPSGLALWS